ncbi:hypothetical protein BANRA_04993 [Klebsiella pneumoniae]|nr:hypothetical protein AF09_05607 [Klebsiella pneumoniae CHS 53]CDL58937.1 hypothetical protein [Klebsiella pneumoniae]SVM78399.1 Uncharacterised protein [Klebsiella pneumoniae]SXK55147.1 Uncharacterised protein [Klebsiella pneumoniae]SYS44876.1 Uncharacterised protein [Klebsiella pneumoniae]
MVLFHFSILIFHLCALPLYVFAGFLLLLFILCNHPTNFLIHIILNTRILRHSIDTTRILSVVGHYRSIVTTT